MNNMWRKFWYNVQNNYVEQFLTIFCYYFHELSHKIGKTSVFPIEAVSNAVLSFPINNSGPIKQLPTTMWILFNPHGYYCVSWDICPKKKISTDSKRIWAYHSLSKFTNEENILMDKSYKYFCSNTTDNLHHICMLFSRTKAISLSVFCILRAHISCEITFRLTFKTNPPTLEHNITELHIFIYLFNPGNLFTFSGFFRLFFLWTVTYVSCHIKNNKWKI